MRPQPEENALAHTKSEMIITQEEVSLPDVTALLEAHFTALFASLKTNSRVLDLSALRHSSITIFTARSTTSNELMGCTALKQISPRRGELKSMRTAANHQRKGVAGALIRYILSVAKIRNYKEVILETGPQEEFAPARALYSRHGFVPCDGFEGYENATAEEKSVFMMYCID
jgi:GNAT superfamily N-acetyltransferase